MRPGIISSTDHRVIGLQYALTSLVFLLIGFALVVVMRWQLAFPGQPLLPFGIVLPEVYNQLAAMHGTIMIIANNTRKPLWGYALMVYSIFAVGFLSFVVWAHHMFLTGMGTTMSTFFQATTLIISIPSSTYVLPDMESASNR